MSAKRKEAVVEPETPEPEPDQDQEPEAQVVPAEPVAPTFTDAELGIPATLPGWFADDARRPAAGL